MAVGGYRVTESSDQRTLEDGSLRVTENLFSVESSISASSSYDFVPSHIQKGNTTLVTTSVVNASAITTIYAAILVANSSNLTAVTGLNILRTFTGNAEGNIVGTSKMIFNGLSTLSSSSTITPTARNVKYVFITSGSEFSTRVLENNDFRITESGDSRITNNVFTNSILGSLVAATTKIPFTSTAYYKTGGVWKQTDVDTKYNGNWDALQSVYKKISGNWKRIY